MGSLSHPQVVDFYEELLVYGQAPGHGDQPIAVRLLQGDYPYFDFQIKAGRMIAGPGEAVMGYAVFELLEVQLGDTVEILVEGEPIRLTVVGRHIENQNLNNVIITSLAAYQKNVDASTEPTTYYLRLKDAGQAESPAPGMAGSIPGVDQCQCGPG